MLNFETWGYSIGSLIVGAVAGGVAMYKMVKKSFTNMAVTPIGNGVLSAFTKELVALETRIESTYLGKESHKEKCKVVRLESQIALRLTLDEIFRDRDLEIDKKFMRLDKQIEINRKITLDHYDNILKEIKVITKG